MKIIKTPSGSSTLGIFAVSSVMAIFLIIGTLIIFITPYSQFPDEDSHFKYARYLKDHHTLPPLLLNEREMPTMEAFQPPLYYALSAFLLLPNIDEHAQIHLLRFFSLVLACASIWLVYKTARIVFPGSEAIAFVSAAVAAFNPQFLYVNCGVSNISMSTFTGSLTIYFAVRLLSRPASIIRESAFLGISFGLAVLSRTLSFCLLPMSFVALLMTRQDKRQVLKSVIIFSIFAFAVGSWWYIYNWVRYGDPMAWRIYSLTMGAAWLRSESFNLFYLVQTLAWLHAYFWIYFGNATYHAGITEYVVYLIVEILSLLGLWQTWRSSTGWPGEKRRFVLLFLLGASAVLEIIALQFRITSPQGRYLFLAIPAFAITIGAGLLFLFPERMQKRGAIGIATFLLSMCAYVLIRYWLPHYI